MYTGAQSHQQYAGKATANGLPGPNEPFQVPAAAAVAVGTAPAVPGARAAAGRPKHQQFLEASP